ncbi:MAG: hypothetical protein EZS28_046603, partial [Streblomastix strix]
EGRWMIKPLYVDDRYFFHRKYPYDVTDKVEVSYPVKLANTKIKFPQI